MPTTYGNDIVYCLKSHCGVRGYCRQKWVLQVQIICKFSNERTCKRNKDVQGLSCGFEVSFSCSSSWRFRVANSSDCWERDSDCILDRDWRRFDLILFIAMRLFISLLSAKIRFQCDILVGSTPYFFATSSRRAPCITSITVAIRTLSFVPVMQ